MISSKYICNLIKIIELGDFKALADLSNFRESMKYSKSIITNDKKIF